MHFNIHLPFLQSSLWCSLEQYRRILQFPQIFVPDKPQTSHNWGAMDNQSSSCCIWIIKITFNLFCQINSRNTDKNKYLLSLSFSPNGFCLTLYSIHFFQEVGTLKHRTFFLSARFETIKCNPYLPWKSSLWQSPLSQQKTYTVLWKAASISSWGAYISLLNKSTEVKIPEGGTSAALNNWHTKVFQ